MNTPVMFTAPLPGLEGANDFTLRSIEGAPGLYALESLVPTPLRLFLADAAIFVPEYSPRVPAAVLADLELDQDQDPQVLVVVTPSADSTTVNLMAPIVLNPGNRRCVQLVLEGRDYPLRAELKSA
ncbi:flagellar assembly protein FliW [Arthrobacter sp. H16F315]|uniref:flagellar assembly protein FliW n=1 Tax=Arthrobacter sp. H16F315 TaxID=2955314 RepID=UPI002097558E|nr:flagellar assembly protein FliW [Arthrobacter sp. H16F315]MDD1475672.1 flagellar assembly protein FliW [Arthrobacter sp. H16F315]